VIGRRVVAVASLLLLLLTPVRSTIAQVPSLGETIEIAIVNVDVFVTDADGKRVRGLTRDDLEIYENGKLQPISHFAEYRGAQVNVGVDLPEGERPPDQPTQRRTLVVFIEMFRLPGMYVDPFIASIKNLVHDSVRSGDSVTIVTFNGKANMRLAATSDVAAAEEVLDQIGRECVGPVRDKTALAAIESAEVKAFDQEGAEMLAARGIIASRPTPDETSAHAARMWALESRLDMNRRVATINTLLHGLAGIDGKKMLLLATHRLGEYVGAEYYYAAGVSDFVIPTSERSDLDNRSAIRSIIANANASGVTIYPMFPTGLDYRPADPAVPDISRPVLMNEMVMLNEIADKTGGMATYGTANAAQLMPRVAEDMADYYSLAYRANSRRADGARAIVVKAKDKKLKVRARREFVEKSDDTQMRDRVLAALHDSPTDATFQLAAELGEIKKVGRKSETAPLKVRIPIGALTLIPQGNKHAGAFTVYAITGGTLGEISEVTRRTQNFDIPEGDLERARAGHFTYDFDVIVNSSTRQLAVGVLDEVSKEYGLVTLPIAKR
jgi:VWFA-related protein